MLSITKGERECRVLLLRRALYIRNLVNEIQVATQLGNYGDILKYVCEIAIEARQVSHYADEAMRGRIKRLKGEGS